MSPIQEYQENINHVDFLSDHVDPDTSTLNKPISEVDRLQFLHTSIEKRERNILNNLPTNVDHSKEIDKLFFTLEVEIKLIAGLLTILTWNTLTTIFIVGL